MVYDADSADEGVWLRMQMYRAQRLLLEVTPRILAVLLELCWPHSEKGLGDWSAHNIHRRLKEVIRPGELSQLGREGVDLGEPATWDITAFCAVRIPLRLFSRVCWSGPLSVVGQRQRARCVLSRCPCLELLCKNNWIQSRFSESTKGHFFQLQHFHPPLLFLALTVFSDVLALFRRYCLCRKTESMLWTQTRPFCASASAL